MIELPEAITLASQFNQELLGKRIASGMRGSSPHKFAFTGKLSDDQFASTVKGKTIGPSHADGWIILTELAPGYVLSLGCGGERIQYHADESTLPKKHQLLFNFQDGTLLTVSVSGWGEVRLLEQSDLPNHPHIKRGAVSPLSEAFTPDYFNSLLDAVPQDKNVSAKTFIVSEPGLWGVGNGCLQDILYRARIHPKRKILDLTKEERQKLYQAVTNTLKQMTNLCGRDSERDLYDQPGGYRRILHSKSVGKPCQQCGAPIEKAQYLGGAIYFCPTCQVV
jgi:formamidopyrimidine-DNA glycosylase